MAQISRVRSSLTGFKGAPGVVTMYSLNPGDMIQRLGSFWNSLLPVLPSDVTVQQENTGDVIEATNGQLVGTWNGAFQPSQDGQDGGSYQSAGGCQIRWFTPIVVDGSRLVGASFIVPLAGSAFATDGGLTAGAQATIQGAADNLIVATASEFVIWHRPRKAREASPGVPARVERAGSFGLVTTASVNPKGAILTSRRD